MVVFDFGFACTPQAMTHTQSITSKEEGRENSGTDIFSS